MISAAELTAIPLFADLPADQLAFLSRAVEDIALVPGEFAVHEGDERALYVVVEGLVHLTKDINGVERVIGPRGPGELYGEVPVMLSMNMPASCVAVEPSRVLKVDVGTFFTLAGMAPQVVATVGALAKGRMEGLKEIAAETATPDMVVVGPLLDPAVHEIRTFLGRNRISYETENAPLTPDGPVVQLADGTRLVGPSMREIALAGGLSVVPARTSRRRACAALQPLRSRQR